MGKIDCESAFVWHMVREKIPHDARLLAVGPGIWHLSYGGYYTPSHVEGDDPHPPQDTGLLALLDHLDAGTVTILDLPSTVPADKAGWHDPVEIESYISSLVERGANLAPYEFVLGNLFDENIELGEFDIIYDHMTWDFARKTHPTNSEPYTDLAQRYHSLLSDSGTAFFYHPLNVWGEEKEAVENLVEALEAVGFSTREFIEITDGYTIEDPVIREDLGRRQIMKQDVAEPYHKAYGLIIAEKGTLENSI